jgi:hypothetical protein
MRTLILLAALLQADPDRTVLTKSGRKITGRVEQGADGVTVRTPLGVERVPAGEVACVFRLPADGARQADERYREAKRVFEEAERLDVAHPARNEKLARAIDGALWASSVYRLLDEHYPAETSLQAGKNVQLIQQFVRICRGASSSEVAGGAAPPKAAALVPLDAFDYSWEPPAEAPRPWVHAAELGPGLGAYARDLESPDAPKRLAAVGRLLHPPSPEHLPELLKLLEAETDPAIVRAVGDGLGIYDAAPLLRSLAWTRTSKDPVKRAVAFTVARAAGDRPAFDFLSAWFADDPPDSHAERAQFASAFRQWEAQSVPFLKDLLVKRRDARLQTEILRQMGVVGDKSFGILLIKAIPSFPKDAVTSLLKLGKPALPIIMEGAKSHEQETRRQCIWILRRLTGVNGINLDHFEKWWAEHRKEVLEQEAADRAKDRKLGFPVEAADFAAYDRAPN